MKQPEINVRLMFLRNTSDIFTTLNPTGPIKIGEESVQWKMLSQAIGYTGRQENHGFLKQWHRFRKTVLTGQHIMKSSHGIQPQPQIKRSLLTGDLMASQHML